jgi:hypothetical protein
MLCPQLPDFAIFIAIVIFITKTRIAIRTRHKHGAGRFRQPRQVHIMRISDNRYSRDRFRFDLALRFIRHEARTQTIRAWTGLSDDRIRKV